MSEIKENAEEVLPEVIIDDSVEYVLTFRECDIVPELARKDQGWEIEGKSKAINEILLIPPSPEVTWDITNEEASEDNQWYTITANLDCDDETNSLIKEKYANYLSVRGI